VRIELGAILAVVLALLSFSRIREHGALPVVEYQAASPTEKTSDDETANSVQTAAGEPGRSEGQTTSETSTGGGRAPSRAAGTPGSSGGSHTDGTISQDAGIADPPVYYLDKADDAYGGESWPTHPHQTPPDATVSQKAFDILRVDWAPVSNGYSTSITVAGTASNDGSYVSLGYFFPKGEACRIYYFLTPGMTAYAHAFCESSGDEWGLVGVVEGSEVTSTPTTAGGTQLVATFDNRAIPPLLETAGRKLHNLSAFTCEEIDDRYAGDSRGGVYCGDYAPLDIARSTLTYRV
jgi:hypothetical protein